MKYLYRLLSLAQRVLNILKIFFGGSRGRVMVFHEICKDSSCDQNSCCCSLHSFERYIQECKHNVCTLDKMLQEHNSNNVVITFDDVPASVYENAYPLLCALNVPFTLYVSPSFLDKDGFISTSQLLEMSSNPLCTVAAHTMTHPQLRKTKDVWFEIYNSKMALEGIAGKEVVHLAYPYGRADSVGRLARRYAQKSGFKTAVCTIPTKVPKNYNSWYIPRMTL